jgi:hypothetical protein
MPLSVLAFGFFFKEWISGLSTLNPFVLLPKVFTLSSFRALTVHSKREN